MTARYVMYVLVITLVAYLISAISNVTFNEVILYALLGVACQVLDEVTE